MTQTSAFPLVGDSNVDSLQSAPVMAPESAILLPEITEEKEISSEENTIEDQVEQIDYMEILGEMFQDLP
jgi:hypothetical protein